MDTATRYDKESGEYVNYSKDEKVFYFDYCISDYAFLNVMNPKYIGCFMDTKQRDLQTLIGEGLNYRDCFNKAKESGHLFVSFQNGRECWADSKIGKYPRVSELECRTPCENEETGKCGGTMRNAIWDIREYQANESQCSTKRPTNCALDEGYNLQEDQCKTQCNKSNVKELCYEDCQAYVVRYRTKINIYFRELTACYDKCNGKGDECPK